MSITGVGTVERSHGVANSMTYVEFGLLCLSVGAAIFYVTFQSLLLVYRYLYFLFAVILLKLIWNAYRTELRGGNRRCTNSVSLKGKTVVITGGTAGTGRAAALHLASRGARVILGCKNPQRAETVVAELKRDSGNNDIIYHQLDLRSFMSVREFADKLRREEERVDVLVNNACVSDYDSHDENRLPLATVDGLTHSFQVNYWSHFLLSNLLLKLLVKNPRSRIINVTSRLHTKPTHMNFDPGEGKLRYPKLTGYPLGKLGNVLFTKELALRLEGSGVKAYAVEPGLTFWRGRKISDWKAVLVLPLLWLIMSSENAAAQTTLYCATERGLKNGEVYFDCRPSNYVSHLVDDVTLREELWDVSLKVTQMSHRRNGKTKTS